MSAPVSHFNLPFQKRPPGQDDKTTSGPGATAAEGSRTRWQRAADVLKDAGIRWSDGDSLRLAASQTYVMLLALFPLLMLILTIAQHVLKDSESTRAYVLGLIDGNNSPVLKEAIQAGLVSAQKATSTTLGVAISLVTAAFTAGGVFVELDVAFNRLFGTLKLTSGVQAAVRETVKERIYGFLLVCGLVLVLLSTIIVSTVINALMDYLPPWTALLALLISGTSSLALLTGALTLCYKSIPDIPVAWKSAALGALTASFLLVLLRALFGWLVVHITSYATYGIIGSVITVMFWFYLTSCILLFGVSVTAAHMKRPPALIAGVAAQDQETSSRA